MNSQTVTFAVETKDGAVQRIGKTFITTPEIRFRGGGIKWYEDKVRIPEGEAGIVVKESNGGFGV